MRLSLLHSFLCMIAYFGHDARLSGVQLTKPPPGSARLLSKHG